MKESENKIKVNLQAKHFDILPKSEPINLRSKLKPAEPKTNSPKKVKMEFLKSGIFDKAIKWLLYFLVFSLPIFILPFSVEIYEFNKTLLLFIVSSLAFLLWIAKMVLVEKRLTFVRTPLDIPIIIFILIAIISTIYSVDKTSSALGFYGRFSDSLMVYLSLAMFYFTAVNVITRPVIARSPAGRRGNPDINSDGRDNMSGDYDDGIASVAHSASLHSRPRNDINNLIKTFLASAFVIAIDGLFYVLGFKFIPWPEAQFRSFNLAGGSLNVLAIYLIPAIIISLSYINKNSKIAAKYALSLFVVLSLFILAAADFILAWIILAVSLAVVLALGVALRLHSPKGTMEPAKSGLIAVVLISLVFIAGSLTFINKDVQSDFSSSAVSDFLRDKLAGGEDNAAREGFTKEVVIEKGIAISVAAGSSKSRPILGSGPGTYLYNFSKFKPAEFNGSRFWNIRFDKAGSEILEKISTIGIAGTLSYLIIIVLAMGMFLKTYRRVQRGAYNVIASGAVAERGNPDINGGGRNSGQGDINNGIASSLNYPSDNFASRNDSSVYLFAAWFALLLFQFLYLEATTTKFIFWLFTAILAGEYCSTLRQTQGDRDIIQGDRDVMASLSNHFILDLKKNKTALSASLAALLMLSASFAASYYYQARFYKAEMAYKNSVVKQSLDQSASDFENIIKLNPYRGEYEVYLSNVSLRKLATVLQEQNEGAVSEEDTRKIGLEAKSAIDHIKRAVELGPNNVFFQQKLGSTYAILNRDLNIEKADEWAIKGYQRAIELEPANPVLRAELGKIYVLQSYRLKADDKADQAIKEFEKAIELKNDYADAILELGLAYEAKGDYEKAIETISSLEGIGNISVNAAFQLGRIYYNSGKINEAKNIFLEIIRIEPNNSNARYSLGLIYEKEENSQAALGEFEAVLSLNLGNKEVSERVDKLKKLVEKENKKLEPILEPVPVIEEKNIEDKTEEEE